MKIVKPLIALAPLALIALASCGSSAETSSSSGAISSSTSEADESGKTPVDTNPKTPEEYFASAKDARKRTSEAEQIRVYTPHANVNDNILENGYLEASMACHINVNEEGGGEGLSSLVDSLDLGGISISDMDIGMVVSAMPLDFCVTGLQKENKDLLLSFKNSIGDRDGSVSITMSGRSAFTSRFTTEFYVEDNKFYSNLSSINALLVLFGGSDYKLPGKGRMCFDVPEYFNAKDLFFLTENDKNTKIFENIDKALEKAGLTLRSSDIIDTFSNLDYELYQRTDAKLWTLEDNSIKLDIKNEDELRQFTMGIYDSSESEHTADERKAYEEDLQKTLDYIDFDHMAIELRFSSKGLTYLRSSYKIKSFGSSETIALEGMPFTIVPSGEWGFRYGLAFEYDSVEPNTLSDSQKAKYEYIDTDDALQSILDAIRDTINQGSSSSEESLSSDESSR